MECKMKMPDKLFKLLELQFRNERISGKYGMKGGNPASIILSFEIKKFSLSLPLYPCRADFPADLVHSFLCLLGYGEDAG
jgi:hypothetical protein